MKEILVSRPEYVRSFNCLGSACEDNCCKQWDITIEKSTYKKYLKSVIPDIRHIAAENILLTKQSNSSWAMMKFNEQGNCAFLEANNLCKIHRTMGPDALSSVCASYPRFNISYKKENIESLSISCPEAARKILLVDTALNIDTLSMTQATFNNSPDLNVEGKIVNLFCANLLMVEQSRIELNLYAVACFLLYAEKLTGTLDSKFAAMENVYLALVKQMQNGEITDALAKINSELTLEVSVLAGIRNAIVEHKNCRGSSTLSQYTKGLNQLIKANLSQDELRNNLGYLHHAWESTALPWLSQRPHILRNYFQYRLYHDRFAISSALPLLKQLYLLVVDYFYIKFLLSSYVLDTKELTEKAVIDVMYSYHAYRQHSQSAHLNFIKGIDSVKHNDDLSLLKLLV